jgi:hypothetical protein
MENRSMVCSSPWCKATFVYNENDMIEVNGVKQEPKTCPKCKSFDSELSGGVTWTDKEYEGSRFDGTPHQIRYKVTNFKL